MHTTKINIGKNSHANLDSLPYRYGITYEDSVDIEIISNKPPRKNMIYGKWTHWYDNAQKRSEGSYLWAYHKGTWVIKDKDWTYWHEDGTLADEKGINELCIYTKKVKK